MNWDIYVGPGVWWPYPYYYSYYPYYPYYYPPRVMEERSVDIYVEPAPKSEGTHYWYYCREPQGYYPNVKKCPKGWMKVVPPVEPSDGEE